MKDFESSCCEKCLQLVGKEIKQSAGAKTTSKERNG